MKNWVPIIAAGTLLLGACAGGAPPAATPAPQDLSALQAELARNPKDVALAIRVGIAYYESKQYSRARDVLNGALAVDRQNYPAQVYLGLSYEELGQLDSARTAYTTALAQTRDARHRSDLEGRLALLTRKEMRAAAREAIALEATLSKQPVTGNAVAVLPFRYVGSNAELQPVGRGLTQLMINDLSKLSQLRLLEREQVQALVDELALADAGRVDPATGARSGRLLRASRVLQGAVQDVPGRTDLRLDATVVDATDARVVATGTGSDKLQQLFALQKQVLFRLVDQMGITLSPADRRALSERPTADLQAFLAFSRGLEAEDRGDWPAAATNFTAAVARDPNFRAAKVRQEKAQSIAQAQGTSSTQLAGGAPPAGGDGDESSRRNVLQTGVTNTVPSVGTTLTNRLGPNPVYRTPINRPPLPEATGGDGPPAGNTGTIIIIITRP